MNREEALIYLPMDDENDLVDLYDEKLFEAKQFLLSRFPISKVIKARITKLHKVETAYQTLGGIIIELKYFDPIELPHLKSIREAFHWYNQQKNRLRLQLSGAKSAGEIASVLDELLTLTRHYAEAWPNMGAERSAELKMNEESNPMDIQAELDRTNADFSLDLNQILSLPNDNVLKCEAKRLSLWLNFENNGWSV